MTPIKLSDTPPHTEAELESWVRSDVLPIALRMQENRCEGHSVEEVVAILEQDND